MFGVWRTRDGDQLHGAGAFQFERLYVRVTPWKIVLGAIAVGAYLLGLLMYLPAEAAVGTKGDTVGTVWRGETALAPGFALGWTTRPVRSVVALAPAADLRLHGPETEILADALWGSDGLVLRRAEGAGSLRLINAMTSALPFTCDGEMTLDATNLAIDGGRTGEGRLQTGPASCVGGGVTTTPPALTGVLTSDAEGSGLSLRGPDNAELARARMARDRTVSLTVTPAGAAILPGMAASTVEIR